VPVLLGAVRTVLALVDISIFMSQFSQDTQVFMLLAVPQLSYSLVNGILVVAPERPII